MGLVFGALSELAAFLFAVPVVVAFFAKGFVAVAVVANAHIFFVFLSLINVW